jgi:DNA-directed RNA polymerase subunit M/transcription elongation factor TFIIS
MHFCVNCENMYYIKLAGEEANELVYYCRNCGHENKNIGVEDIFVSRTNLKPVDNNYVNIINKYTKFDPTLPRVTNVTCPNSDCSKTNKEIIMMRYDDKNLKYVYLCPECDTTWKN